MLRQPARRQRLAVLSVDVIVVLREIQLVEQGLPLISVIPDALALVLPCHAIAEQTLDWQIPLWELAVNLIIKGRIIK